MVPVEFSELSYQAQVARLRVIAGEALARFPLRVDSMRLLVHGENTTFRVWDSRGRQFVLRLNVRAYHPVPNVKEELGFLCAAREVGLHVPEPVPSRDGRLVEELPCDLLGHPAQAVLFKWVPGRLLGTNVSMSRARAMGELVGRLQSLRFAGRRRKYWSAEKLLGTQATFGVLDQAELLSRKEQQLVTEAREQMLAQVSAYERGSRSRSGYIHADLHTHNLVLSDGHLAAIDFDDCGRGLLMYDVAVPVVSLRQRARKIGKDARPMVEALLGGYQDWMSLDAADEEILLPLVYARGLVTACWLHVRRDNPALRHALERLLPRVVTLARDVIGGRYRW